MMVKFLAIYESWRTLYHKRARCQARRESLDKYDIRREVSFDKDTKWN